MNLKISVHLVLLCATLMIPVATLAQEVPPAPDGLSQQQSVGTDRAGGQAAESAKKLAFDASVISQGQSAFQANCTQCHDASLSLHKQKTLNGWRNTVRRMAGLEGATIPSGDFEAIAVYLTSVHRGADATLAESKPGDADAKHSEADADERISVFASLSPMFRSGTGDIQDAGFMPETWLGVSFQPKGFVSARATACFTCHNEADEGLLSRIDLVEAAVRFDFMQLIEPRCRGNWQAAVDAGRFVVPFGAFASQVNPGVYRTVSQPLIYNMGQRVSASQLGDPVLPMPYSDEGANLSFTVPLTEAIKASWDGYVVNGLQGDANGLNFHRSTDYVDNNRSPAIGSRLTIGNQHLRIGGSIMGGRFANFPNAPPVDSGLTYLIFGADITARYRDLLRIQAEFAQRNSDRVVELPGVLVDRESVRGGYVEGELLICRRYKISALVRYDEQVRTALLPPAESSLSTGDFCVSRFTYGLNWTLPGGSLLMVNHEYWRLPKGLQDVNVVGVRWAATF